MRQKVHCRSLFSPRRQGRRVFNTKGLGMPRERFVSFSRSSKLWAEVSGDCSQSKDHDQLALLLQTSAEVDSTWTEVMRLIGYNGWSAALSHPLGGPGARRDVSIHLDDITLFSSAALHKMLCLHVKFNRSSPHACQLLLRQQHQKDISFSSIIFLDTC